MDTKYTIVTKAAEWESGSGFSCESIIDREEITEGVLADIKENGVDWISAMFGWNITEAEERIIEIVNSEGSDDAKYTVEIYDKTVEDGEEESEPVFEASKWVSEAAREYYDENKLCDVELIEKPATRRALNGIYYNLSGYCWCGEEQALLKISEGYYDKYYCLRDDEHYKKIVKNKGYGTLYLDRYCNDKLISREMLFTMD